MTTCSRTVSAHLVGDTSWTELPVTLLYRAAEPYAVTVTIGRECIEWSVSRDLVRDGTAHPAGAGDVRFWPGHELPNDQLFLYLRPPSGEALLELRRSAVLEFLDCTESLVPTGTESAATALDAELQALLDGDPW